MSPASIKFFTGAPLVDDLNWTDECLLHTLLPAFDTGNINSGDRPCSTSSVHAAWRHIAQDGVVLVQTPLRKQWPHHRPDPRATDLGDDFIEHSLAVLDALASSQIAPHTAAESDIDEESTFLTCDSFSTSWDASTISPGMAAATSPSPLKQPVRPIKGIITPLLSIPSAKHLIRSRPQTITVNLIVGIISIAAPRTVHIKRGDYDMEIIEVIVGDETKQGFSITVWLNAKSKHAQTHAKVDLRNEVEALRAGHVVHVSNLALADYNGQVFGQSVNRRASGVATRFVPLDTTAMAPSILHGPDIVEKTKRVEAFVDQFIGTRNEQARKRRLESTSDGHRTKNAKVTNRTVHEWLPDDSQ